MSSLILQIKELLTYWKVVLDWDGKGLIRRKCGVIAMYQITFLEFER